MEQVLASLSSFDRRICDHLGRLTVTEAASELGMSRATLRAHRDRIRKRFEQAGLSDYFPTLS